MMKLLKDSRILVLIGVMMTITSATISHIFVQQNIDVIALKEAEISELQMRIEHRWQNKLALERREDFGTVLGLLVQIKTPGEERQQMFGTIEHYLRSMLQHMGDQKIADGLPVLNATTEQQWHAQVRQASESYKRTVIDDIDMMYIERLGLEGSISRLKEDNMLLSQISLFFQVIGLILVLSNNLRRPHDDNRSEVIGSGI